MTEAPDPFAPLRARFMNRLAEDRIALSTWDGSSADTIIPVVHRLAGLAGTLGYSEISTVAKAFEAALLGGGSNGHEARTMRDSLLERVDICLEKGPTGSGIVVLHPPKI
ncbi:Hpt domain-containing protein [Novosphingobium sp. BL-52-GroH]|uniref:Hpt domain-containing protein n=1 Tax=Novosphingobium sp. BL-52-GroH TaxID=3349877 RepID=UPI00384B38C8